MPDTESVRQSASLGALRILEEKLQSDALLVGLRLADPWFGTGVGEIGLLNDNGEVVVVSVDINDLGHALHAGAFGRTTREPTDVAGAAMVLGLTPGKAERILDRAEQSVRAGIGVYDAALAGHAQQEMRLTRNMDALTDGMERIARIYGEHVTLEYEDPETFGGGHLVLYAMTHSNARFAIEERYAGSDWSDPDRLPTSWAWRAERLARRTDGSHGWQVSARGTVDSDDVVTLLRQAETWAKRTRDIAIRADAYRQSPPGRTPPEGPRL